MQAREGSQEKRQRRLFSVFPTCTGLSTSRDLHGIENLPLGTLSGNRELSSRSTVHLFRPVICAAHKPAELVIRL